MAPPSEDTVKERIISHMNKDHHDSVVRYAEFPGGASRFAARNAILTDITLDKLSISLSDRTVTVPLDPPMSSLRDARERLVALDKQALTSLGRSAITLKEYAPPQGFAIVVFTVCLSVYVMYSRETNLIPGSLLYDHFFTYFPRFAGFALMMRNYVIWPMLAIHFGEAYLMTGTLRKHSVPLFSGVWWLWVTDCFVEGFDTFRRISILEKEKLAKQSKH